MKNFQILTTLFASTLFVSSCTKKIETATPSTQAGNPTQNVNGPKTGGTLVVGRASDSIGLDPAFETDGESFFVADNIFDTLVRFKKDSTEIVPGIAERWEVSKDGLTYTFYIRQGIKFHSGEPLKLSDVVATFERQINPKSELNKDGGIYKYWESMGMDKIVKSVTSEEPNKVMFKLATPEAPFLANLAMSFAGIINAKKVKELGKQHSFQPDGTGPFKFVSWERGSQITLTKNENYWEGPVYLDKLIFKVIPENTSRALELQQASIHIMDSPSVEDVNVLEKLPHVNILKTQGLNVLYLALNMDKQFKDKNLRLAVNHAINKERIVSLAFGGNAIPAKNPIPPSIWSYNDAVQDYPYNEELAKQYLAKSKVKGPIKFYVMPPRPYNPNSDKLAVLIQEDLRKIGLEVKIEKYEWASYLDKISNGDHDMCTIGWIGDNGDPDNFLYILLDETSAKKPAQNYAFYKSDALHKLLVQAKKESAFEKRKALYEQAQKIIKDDAPWVPLVHTPLFYPHLKTVRDFVVPPLGSPRYEKVWLQQ